MKRFLILSLALSLTSPFLSGCGDRVKSGTSEIARQEVTGLKVSEVKPHEVPEYIEATGTVKAKNVSYISSKVMGAVTSVKVSEGERVRAAEVLLTIDDSDVKEKVRAAEAGYREAQKGLEAVKENRSLSEITYQRYKKLKDERAISQQEFDQIETQRKTAGLEYERMEAAVKRAEANLSEARVYLGYSKVTAPFSGVVTEKKVDTGSMAAPGVPLLTIEDTSSYTLDANVDERLLGKLSPGMPVEVIIESLGKGFEGRITEVVPSINPASRAFLVKISLKGEGLKTGLYAKVKLPAGKKTLLTVPEAAIVSRGQLTGVYSIDEKGVITYRLVRTGSSYNRNVEILSGISPGERIVTGGVEKAVDGGVVK